MSACNCPRPDQCPTCRANEALRAAQKHVDAVQLQASGSLAAAQAYVLNRQKPWWRRRTLRDRVRYAWREFRR